MSILPLTIRRCVSCGAKIGEKVSGTIFERFPMQTAAMFSYRRLLPVVYRQWESHLRPHVQQICM